ncbi:hypothetical protein B0T25DRAFT_224365 [Lasiosphaeria hispida]|uniref:MARVEL domain-containing protein n=1 Tax=Lasiosphaeria hispida TaxID=260671 RepID=A0AAJ0MF00_9PEZI|nr:hypothetical protein B0T25DRAFT_224365 [Lasiosphaeria hispida]
MESKPKKTKGTASRVLSVFLRLAALTCGAIVLGLLARAFYLIDNAGVIEPNGRLVFTAVVASLTIIGSIAFMPPMAYAFWFFPVDFLFFAAWLTAYCLLQTLTGTNSCEADWFNNYWGYYWGRWYWVGPVGVDVQWTGCSAWRTVLAFSFVAFIVYLLSGILGLYWALEYGRLKNRGRSTLRSGRGPKTEKRGSNGVIDNSVATPAGHTASTTATTAGPGATTAPPAATAVPASDAAAHV